MSTLQRPRRNRRSTNIRALVRETRIHTDQLVWPLFVADGDEREPIASMPGCFRLGIKPLLKEIDKGVAAGLRAVALFPRIRPDLKDPRGSAALDKDGLYARALRAIKDKHPDLCLISDVAMDPYSSDGHDGLVREGKVVNDPTLDILAAMSVLQAEAGADFVAASDMMDGRIRAIRRALDHANLTDTGIISYAAKYASAYYGPFRDALASAPKSGDKKTYQMDPANAREALREVSLDIQEGADVILIKPALAYLDIVAQVRTRCWLPIAAYNVSGEYAMVKAASANGWLDEKRIVLETLTAMARAGADMIFTYHALDAARWINQGES